MVRKIGFALLWLSFIAYALLLAPPDSPETLDLIKHLSIGDIEGINPAIVALFNLMGIWPGIYACVLFADGREQNLRAFPFAIGSFALGAFALIPYLALREPNPNFAGTKDRLLAFFDSRLLAIFLAVAATVLVTFGILKGDWSDFVVQWQTRRFIHVMSLDFCLLCLLFSALIGDDLARRNLSPSGIWRGLGFVPLFGPLLYLCLRPPLAATEGEENAIATSSALH